MGQASSRPSTRVGVWEPSSSITQRFWPYTL